jgi:hypothetical protein
MGVVIEICTKYPGGTLELGGLIYIYMYIYLYVSYIRTIYNMYYKYMVILL